MNKNVTPFIVRNVKNNFDENLFSFLSDDKWVVDVCNMYSVYEKIPKITNEQMRQSVILCEILRGRL